MLLDAAMLTLHQSGIIWRIEVNYNNDFAD